MTATAHILIKIEAGKAKNVYRELLKLSPVQHIDAVTGPYDFIVTIQGTDFGAIGRTVFEKIHLIEGIEETVTCNVISIEV